MAFCKDYNAKTDDKAGYVIPVEITVYDDKSFTFILKTRRASVLLLKAADYVRVEKGSKDQRRRKWGRSPWSNSGQSQPKSYRISTAQTIESAMRIIAGTAANMGVDIDPPEPVLKPKKKQLV